MTASLALLLKTLQIVSGAILLPGMPVDITACDSGFLIACTGQPGVCHLQVNSSGIPHLETNIQPWEMSEPADLCIWGESYAVSDRGSSAVFSGENRFQLKGIPEGICQVQWTAGSNSLAVCLFQPGMIILMDRQGRVKELCTLPGAKSVAQMDWDLDGDSDLVVSCCGGGVYLLENAEGEAVVHWIGNIGDGVKRLFATHMNSDGFADVVGIACAQGGAAWWANPGIPGEVWQQNTIRNNLKGPKCLSCLGDSVIIGSLFTPLYSNFSIDPLVPEGCISVCIDHNGTIVSGYVNGAVSVLVRESY